MSTSITATSYQAASQAQTASQSTTTSTQDTLANKETFLQLLVAQIKNQDPLNPTDGVQFLSQLAQFTELEQIMAIRSSLEGMASAQTGGGTGSAKTTPPQSPPPGNLLNAA